MKRNRKEPAPGPIGYRDGLPVFAVECEGLTASFRCPTCGAINRHGLGPDGRTFGHRLGHCQCWAGGYYLDGKEARNA
jgi:hypothetical protein